MAYSHNQKKDNKKLKIKTTRTARKLNCGSLTTKELKKKHLFRLVGGAEMGSWVERMSIKVVAGGPGSPIFACR